MNLFPDLGNEQVGRPATYRKCIIILLILYQIVSLDSWEVHSFCCCNRPSDSKENFISSDLFDGEKKQKNLLNEDTSKDDHILLGPQYTAGLSFASATHLLHSLRSVRIPRTACCLSAFSLRGWTAPECYLSIHESEKDVRPPPNCWRNQPPILQEHCWRMVEVHLGFFFFVFLFFWPIIMSRIDMIENIWKDLEFDHDPGSPGCLFFKCSAVKSFHL